MYALTCVNVLHKYAGIHIGVIQHVSADPCWDDNLISYSWSPYSDFKYMVATLHVLAGAALELICPHATKSSMLWSTRAFKYLFACRYRHVLTSHVPAGAAFR